MHLLAENFYNALGFASRDLLLPDIGMIQGRTLVVAWDIGLDDVATDVVSLLVTAVQVTSKIFALDKFAAQMLILLPNN